jgi:hypothetical protein
MHGFKAPLKRRAPSVAKSISVGTGVFLHGERHAADIAAESGKAAGRKYSKE